MPPDSSAANDFSTGETYLIDLSDPDGARASRYVQAGLNFTALFERLENLDVLATFQTEERKPAGGIARLLSVGDYAAWGSAREAARRPFL